MTEAATGHIGCQLSATFGYLRPAARGVAQRRHRSPSTLLTLQPRSSMKVIIPLAGKGTRLRPHTHVTPKPMLKVAGKPGDELRDGRRAEARQRGAGRSTSPAT